MKVIITGSESFVGKVLIAYCIKKGIEVFGIDVVAPPKTSYTFLQGDIRDRAIREKIPSGADALIHLAALSRDADCKGRPYECFEANVMGTLNMMSAATAAGTRQFIFASSEWVYESFDGDKEKDEMAFIDISKHTSEYALSKLVSETNLRQNHLQNGMATTVLRFAIIYGPRPKNWSSVESLVASVKKGEKINVGSLQTGRRFIHVDDIAEGICATIGLSGFEIINLSGDTLITLGDIIHTSEKIYSKIVPVIETAPEKISVRNPSNKKAKTMLVWKPRINLLEGIQSLDPFV